MPQTTISHSDDEIITEDIEECFTMNKEECKALLKECAHSWISYENPLAREVISRMWDFVYKND